MNDASKMEFYALAGFGLRAALSNQVDFAKRLTQALVESGALTKQAAEAVLLGTAEAAEKRAGPHPLGTSHYLDALAEPQREHAQALRGVTRKLGVRKPKAAASA
jgi:hypothetical protein